MALGMLFLVLDFMDYGEQVLQREIMSEIKFCFALDPNKYEQA
jgi:hypothetical protein